MVDVRSGQRQGGGCALSHRCPFCLSQSKFHCCDAGKQVPFDRRRCWGGFIFSLSCGSRQRHDSQLRNFAALQVRSKSDHLACISSGVFLWRLLRLPLLPLCLLVVSLLLLLLVMWELLVVCGVLLGTVSDTDTTPSLCLHARAESLLLQAVLHVRTWLMLNLMRNEGQVRGS